jgi:hypothetical protein
VDDDGVDGEADDEEEEDDEYRGRTERLHVPRPIPFAALEAKAVHNTGLNNHRQSFDFCRWITWLTEALTEMARMTWMTMASMEKLMTKKRKTMNTFVAIDM